MKKIIVFCFLAVLVFSCGSKKAVATKKKSSKSRTEHVVIRKDSKTNTDVDKNANEVVNGIEVKINSTEEYISLFKGIAQEEMRLYNIPASITLAQGILESNSGKGTLSVEANNHFGIKCHDWTGDRIYHDDDTSQECFRKYTDSKYSFRDHSLFLSQRQRYSGLFKLKKEDYKGWARELRNAGYATDRKYPDKLIGLIERYELYKFDEEVLGSSYTKYEEPTDTSSTYIVDKGDSMYSISKKYKLSVKELQDLNDLRNTALNIGQVLIVKDNTSNVKTNTNQTVQFKPITKISAHIVAKGDTLYSISKKYNMTVNELQQLNNLNDNAISIGQELQVKSVSNN